MPDDNLQIKLKTEEDQKEDEEENEEEEWVLVGNAGLDELLEGEDSEVLEKCV